MNQFVHLIEPFCNGFNIHLKITLYYDWIIENTADATYCQHPDWAEGKGNDIENLFPYDYEWISGKRRDMYFLGCGIYTIIWAKIIYTLNNFFLFLLT